MNNIKDVLVVEVFNVFWIYAKNWYHLSKSDKWYINQLIFKHEKYTYNCSYANKYNYKRSGGD